MIEPCRQIRAGKSLTSSNVVPSTSWARMRTRVGRLTRPRIPGRSGSLPSILGLIRLEDLRADEDPVDLALGSGIADEHRRSWPAWGAARPTPSCSFMRRHISETSSARASSKTSTGRAVSRRTGAG